MDLKQLRYCKYRVWLRENALRCSLLRDADGSMLISSMGYCNAEDCPVPGVFRLRERSIEEQVEELTRGL